MDIYKKSLASNLKYIKPFSNFGAVSYCDEEETMV